MAANESIGGIQVEIVASYQDLQAGIDSAAQIAQAGGEKIAESLNAGAAGADSLSAAVTAAALGMGDFDAQIEALVASGMTLAEALAAVDASTAEVGTSAEAAATAIEAVGTAATDAGAGVEQVGAAAAEAATGLGNAGTASAEAAAGMNEAGNAAHDAAGGFQEAGAASGELGENLVKLAEAFVVFEGLREFGAEAAEAADTITRANIALTALTGSAEAVGTQIEAIEKLGISDGLALPSVLQAATRMTALLGASEDIPGILAHIADGAAVMGTSIEAAANAFDRIATTGTVGARQLVQLGLSLDQLAAAMNTVSGNTEATAENVSAMFKALDQSDRIEVLNQALSRLSGTAAAAAQATFGGQWQSLADQWEQVMAEVGKALLPVISGLTDLMRTDIVPWVKSAVDAFTSLPEPVKDTAVALGLAVTALAGFEVIAKLVSGFTALAGAITAVGGASAEAAVAETAQAAAATAAATATEAAGAAAATAATETAAAVGGEAVAMGTAAGAAGILGTALGAVGAAGSALLASPIFGAAMWIALAAAVGEAAVAWAKMRDAQAGLSQATAELGTQVQTLEVSLSRQGIDISALKTQYDSGRLSLEQYLAGLHNLSVEFIAAHPAAVAYADSVSLAMAASEGAALHMQGLKDTVAATAAALQAATLQFNETGQGADKVTTAYAAWQAATAALDKAQGTLTETVSAGVKATRDFDAASLDLVSAEKAQADQVAAQQISWNQLGLSLNTAQQNLHSVLTDIENGIPRFGALATAQNAVTTAQNALNNAWANFANQGAAADQSLSGLARDVQSYGASVTVAGLETVQLGTYTTQASDVMKSLGLDVDGLKNKVDALIVGYQKYGQVGGDTLTGEDALWNKVYQDLSRNVEEYPKLISLADEHIARIQALGASEQELLTAEAQRYTASIKYETEQGQDATADILALHNITLQQQALTDQSQLMGKTIAGVEDDIIHGLENWGQSISQVIVEGGNLADAFVKVGEKILETIMTTIINAGMKALVNEIILEVIPTHVAMGSAAVAQAGTMAAAFHTATASMSADIVALKVQIDALNASMAAMIGTAAGSGGAGAAGGVSSIGTGVLGLIGVIAAVIQAIASVIGDIEQLHTQSILNSIEYNTRYLQIQAEKYFEVDSWAQQKGITDKLDMIYNQEGQLLSEGFTNLIAVDTAGFQSLFEQLKSMAELSASGGASGGGGGGTGLGYPVAPPLTPTSLPPITTSTPPTVNVTAPILTGTGGGTGTVSPIQIGSVPPGTYGAAAVPVSQSVYNSSQSSTTSGPTTLNFTIHQASDPRETARQIAATLTAISPKFSAVNQ